ncbi:hypothetical protein DRN63_00740 [Nanoarchaeota archaeon]|nr:MAG: hypothetical protein DRN63_00740 [Nanoarchaeota archaeon]
MWGEVLRKTWSDVFDKASGKLILRKSAIDRFFQRFKMALHAEDLSIYDKLKLCSDTLHNFYSSMMLGRDGIIKCDHKVIKHYLLEGFKETTEYLKSLPKAMFDDIMNEWTHFHSVLDAFLTYLYSERDEKVAGMVNDLIELDSSRSIAVEVLGYAPTKNPEILATSLKKLFHLPDVCLVKIATNKRGSYEYLDYVIFKSRKYPHLTFKLSKSSFHSGYVTLTISSTNPLIKGNSVSLDVNLSHLPNSDIAKAISRFISESGEYFKKLGKTAEKIIKTIPPSILKLSFLAENPIRITTKPLTFNDITLISYDLKKCFDRTIEKDLKIVVGGKTFTYGELEGLLKRMKRSENITL